MWKQIRIYVFGFCISFPVVVLGIDNPADNVFEVARHYRVSPHALVGRFSSDVISQAFASCKGDLTKICEGTSNARFHQLYPKFKVAVAYGIRCEFQDSELENVMKFVRTPLDPEWFPCNMLWIMTLDPNRADAYYEILAEIYRRFYIPGSSERISDEQATFIASELSSIGRSVPVMVNDLPQKVDIVS